jgi:hypothetical protein
MLTDPKKSVALSKDGKVTQPSSVHRVLALPIVEPHIRPRGGTLPKCSLVDDVDNQSMRWARYRKDYCAWCPPIENVVVEIKEEETRA